MEYLRSYFKVYLFFISALSLIISSTSAMGAIIQVPADHLTIQAGINAAVNENTVLVSDGTYKGMDTVTYIQTFYETFNDDF